MVISLKGYVSVHIFSVLPIFIAILRAKVFFLFNYYKMMNEPSSNEGNNIYKMRSQKT